MSTYRRYLITLQCNKTKNSGDIIELNVISIIKFNLFGIKCELILTELDYD